MRKTDDIYDAVGGPLYAVHYNGLPYAKFAGPNQAAAYWRGLDAKGREYFHIENAEGERVTGFGGTQGHATAILDTLNAAARREEASERDDFDGAGCCPEEDGYLRMKAARREQSS